MLNESYQNIIQEHLTLRQLVNPAYSLRSFAKDLEILPSQLSSVLKGTQGLSALSANKIAKNLKLTKTEKESFLNLVMASHARAKKDKLKALKNLSNRESSSKREIQDAYFKVISHWYYYAFLELMTLESFESNPQWISKQLNISEEEVNKMLHRLQKLNLIKFEGGEYKSNDAQLDTTYDIPSSAIKHHNGQILHKAHNAILEQELEKREISSLTIAINEEDIPYVKERIRQFRNELDQELMKRSKKKGANKVYVLATQFFDLLKGNKDED